MLARSPAGGEDNGVAAVFLRGSKEVLISATLFRLLDVGEGCGSWGEIIGEV